MEGEAPEGHLGVSSFSTLPAPISRDGWGLQSGCRSVFQHIPPKHTPNQEAASQTRPFSTIPSTPATVPGELTHRHAGLLPPHLKGRCRGLRGSQGGQRGSQADCAPVSSSGHRRPAHVWPRNHEQKSYPGAALEGCSPERVPPHPAVLYGLSSQGAHPPAVPGMREGQHWQGCQVIRGTSPGQGPASRLNSRP